MAHKESRSPRTVLLSLVVAAHRCKASQTLTGRCNAIQEPWRALGELPKGKPACGEGAKYMRQSYRMATYVAVAAFSSLAASENKAAPPIDPLASLAGRWVGMATMTSDSGPASNFKCVVTYIPRQDVRGMRQTLRCEDGASFKLHAATDLSVEGDKVTGLWQDKINEIGGTVDGIVTPDGFDVQLSGKFFEAHMAVAGQGCDQSVKVMPHNSDMFRELAATLKKC